MRNFDDSDHLLFHGKAYLKAARLCLCEIMHDRHSWCENNERVPDSFKPIHYFIDDLLPPALYSIQHGIEVCFKAILLDAGINIKKFSHRTNDLFIAVKEYVLNTDWQPITINEWQELITQEEIDRIKNQVFSELEPLVDYFFYNEILFTKLGREKKPDPNNEIFRYPKSMSGDDYDIMDLASKISKDDVEDLIKKIDKIYGHLMDIGYLIGETNAQQKNPGAVFG